MKKTKIFTGLTAILATTSIVFSFVACGNSAEKKQTDTDTTTKPVVSTTVKSAETTPTETTTVKPTETTTIKSTEATAPKKSKEEIAKEVMSGKWGSGEERKKALENAGYDYDEIQSIINKLAEKPTNKPNNQSKAEKPKPNKPSKAEKETEKPKPTEKPNEKPKEDTPKKPEHLDDSFVYVGNGIWYSDETEAHKEITNSKDMNENQVPDDKVAHGECG